MRKSVFAVALLLAGIAVHRATNAEAQPLLPAVQVNLSESYMPLHCTWRFSPGDSHFQRTFPLVRFPLSTAANGPP